MPNLSFNLSFDFISPNYGVRPEGMAIDTIIIHYTDMKDDISALKRLCDKRAEVSAHYLINKLGQIFSLVPDHLRAWHAGPSCWMGRHKVNDFSIGIELDNNGYEEFSKPLMDSLISLCQHLMKIHPIKHRYVLGHSDIAPFRKFDPGRLFNWQMLHANNIGVYPQNIIIKEIPTELPPLVDIQTSLAEFGYNIAITGVMDQQSIDVMRAFNEHFNPECYEVWNRVSQAKLDKLLELRVIT